MKISPYLIVLIGSTLIITCLLPACRLLPFTDVIYRELIILFLLFPAIFIDWLVFGNISFAKFSSPFIIVALTTLYALTINSIFNWINLTNFSRLFEDRLQLLIMFTACQVAAALIINFEFKLKNESLELKYFNESKELLKNAELHNLKNQLQPHFLFNSLNSVHSLVGKNPEAAREMIELLSSFLRNMLQSDRREFSTFAEEIELISTYLEIEKIRFQGRLNIQLKTETECNNLPLPSLILQPLVENAIKYGMYEQLGMCLISIQSSIENNLLKITIENPYEYNRINMNKSNSGFGLDATQKRLFLLYGRNDLVHIKNENNLFIITLQIPINAV